MQWYMMNNMPMPMSNRATRVVPHSSTHTHTIHTKAIVNHHRACSRSRSHRNDNDDICCCRCCRFDTCVYVLSFFQSSTRHTHTCLFALVVVVFVVVSLSFFRCYCSCINGSTCVYCVWIWILLLWGGDFSLSLLHSLHI